MSAFYDLGALDQVAVNLFYGWGYNFYRLENQLRADDLLIRSKICWLLGLTRSSIEAAQSAYRKKFLPPPTRDKPRPDADALEQAASLEELCSLIGQLEGQIRSLPVPENDRMTQRYRQEAPTLIALGMHDRHLIGRAETLRSMLEGRSYEWVLPNAAEIRAALAAMVQDVQARQALLQ